MHHICGECPMKIICQRCQPMFRYFPKERQWLIEISQKTGNADMSAWSRYIPTWLNLPRLRRRFWCFRHCGVISRRRAISSGFEAIGLEVNMEQCRQKHAREIILNSPVAL